MLFGYPLNASPLALARRHVISLRKFPCPNTASISMLGPKNWTTS